MLTMAARREVHEGDWLIAERQSAGRGREGRQWLSPAGNLYASGLVQLGDGDPSAPTLALVAGIAVFDAIGVPGLMLKWPNDVLAMAGMAKLAGILLERQGDVVVVGVGINITSHPDLVERPTVSLAGLGIAASAGDIIERLADKMVHWMAAWRTNMDIIRSAWIDRAHPLGSALSVSAPDGTRIVGHFDGLTDDCALRLRLASGETRVIHVGDVFLI